VGDWAAECLSAFAGREGEALSARTLPWLRACLPACSPCFPGYLRALLPATPLTPPAFSLPLPLQDERKAAAVRFLAEVGPPPRHDLYIPTNPHCRVLGVIPDSAAPMQVRSELSCC
jgi:hypothetical protein